MDIWRDHLKRSSDTVEMLTGFKRMIVGQDSFITSYNKALIPLIQEVNSSLGAACHAMVNAAIPEPLSAIEQWGKDFAALQASIESINAFLPDINHKGLEDMVNTTVSTDQYTEEAWMMEADNAVEEVQDAPSRPAETQVIVTPGLEKYLARLNQYIANHSILTGKERYQHDLSRQLAWLPLTEMGNALRMYYRFHEVIRFVPEKGKYFVWSGRVWKEDAAESHVIEMARKTIAYLDVEATLLPLPTDDNGNLLQKPEISITSKPTPEQEAILKKFDDRDKQVAALNKWMKSSQSKKAIDAVLWILRKLTGIPVSLLDFDAHDYLVNFPNGTLDLRTGKLHKHNPAELHTKIMGTPFMPDAPAPYWVEKFVKKITRGDEGIARFLQQLVGEGLAGVQQDDVLPVCYGPGSNGKTVFSEIIKEGFGDYADMANSDLFLTKQSEGISNDRAALVGVRFLTASETDEGRKLNEAIVKSLTGGDTQKVRFLRQEFFTYLPKFTPMLFTNHKPIITGTDNGIWRRVKLVPWLHNFELDPEREDKPDVMAKMRAELPGIIAWAYRGYQDRQANGKLFIPEVVLNDTLEYRQQSDSMGEYLEDHTVRDEEEATETVDALYADYKTWANDAGITSYTLSKKGFGMKLKDRTDIPFLRSVKGTGGVRLWKGIRLLKEGEEPHTTKKQEQPSQGQPAQPPKQEALPVVPTADQIANWPEDAMKWAGEPRSYPCLKHPDGRWVPYCSEEIDGPVWRYACNGCHPEVVASKGAKYTI